MDFLIKNQFHVTISLDGPKNVHDKFRKDFNGKPSFEKVIGNLIKLYRKSPKYVKNYVSFNSVITPLTGTTEQFDFLEKLCKLDIIPIEVSESDYFSKYLKANENSIEKNNVPSRITYSFLRKGILKEAARYHSAYTTGCFHLKIFPGGFCVPGSHRIFVNPEGKLLVCERVDDMNEHFCIGNVDTGVNIDQLKKLIDITKNNIDKCKSCWAAKLCDICFRDIFNLTDNFCEEKKQEIESGIVYYLNNFKDNKEAANVLENFY